MAISWLLKPRLLVLIPLILVLAVAAACGEDATPTPTAKPTPTATPTVTPTPVPAGPKMGGIVRFVPPGDIQGLDPIAQPSLSIYYHSQLMSDQLFGFDDDAVPQPQMVDTWDTSSDGLTWTFTLRDGLNWHDGRPVTSEEVVLTLERFVQKNALGKVLAGFTDRWEEVNDKTFRVTLTQPFGVMLATLSQPVPFPPVIMRREDAIMEPTEPGEGKIGSGPFKFVEWRPGASVKYERNDAYQPRPEPASGYAGG